MRWMRWNRGFTTLPLALLACAIAAPAAAQETTPAMVAAAAKEGKVVWYSSIDVKVAELIAQGVSCRISEYPDRGRAIGVGARVPADQPGVPVGHQERRCRQLVRCFAFPLLEAAEVARAACSARREALSRAVQGSGRLLRRVARDAERDGLQHQPGAGQGCADRLSRPSRSEMERQARQIASGLQRHQPDRHLRDREGCSAGTISKSCPSRECSNCSRRRQRRRASPAANGR